MSELHQLALNLSRFAVVGGAEFKTGMDPVLAPFLARLGVATLPDELNEYLQFCTPVESFEVSAGWIFSAQEIANYFDGGGTPEGSLDVGLFSFGNLDGSAIAYSIHDGRVYVMEGPAVLPVQSLEAMLKESWQEYDSIHDFLRAGIAAAIETCADRGEEVPPEI